eukprot:gene2382-2847_t
MGNTPSGFNGSSTADQVTKDVNLEGKVVIVTGANAGLGKETARAMANTGATVIMAARNQEKAKSAKEELEKQIKNPKNLHLIELDLGDFKSIENFISEFKKLNLPLHILINNAGVMATPQQKTKDGFEYQLGINHYGHYKLTMGLLPIMVETSKKEKDFEGRIVCLSSAAHTMGKFDFDNLHWEKEGTYGPWVAYGRSKLANVLFARALNRRLVKDKINITANALHPGGIMTDLQRDLPAIQYYGMAALGTFLFKSIPQGAATTCYVATSDQIKGKGGLYFDDCNISETIAAGNDEELQEKLWSVTEKETKVEYPKFE